jgi:hypothetical protein
MNWIESAFPRHSCKWLDDFREFHHDDEGHEPNLDSEGAVVVINGAFIGTRSLMELNDSLLNFKWVLLVLIGDEGSFQHLEWIQHPNLSVWIYDPKPGKFKESRYHNLPAGALQMAFCPPREKTLDWFFSGSVRDINWDRAIRDLRGNGLYYDTHLGYEGYAEHLSESKVVPCRPSWTSPETCRVYDALESGCIPIVGIYPGENPPGHYWWRGYGYDWDNFWMHLFGEQPPFPVIRTPNALDDAVQNTLREWPENQRRVHAWWVDYKIRLVDSLRADAKRLQQ